MDFHTKSEGGRDCLIFLMGILKPVKLRNNNDKNSQPLWSF